MTHSFHVHLVSDSTGETVASIARSVLSQFGEVDPKEHSWTLVRTARQMERVIDGIHENPGIVMYTIMDKSIRKSLVKACEEMDIPCVAVLDRVIRKVSTFLGTEAAAKVGSQYELDDEYFERVEAVNYTLAHDDGQNAENLEAADVVLVGVSRASKTPTCVYLAYRGYRAANVPYVVGCPLPESLYNLKNTLVVGLVINPDSLVHIRKSRLSSLHEDRDTSYVDLAYIEEEVKEARKFFNQQGWPIIDVTRRSIEETTAKVIQLHEKFHAKDD